MRKLNPLFTWKSLKILLTFLVFNMILSAAAYFVFDYNIFIPMIFGAFGGFFAGYFFGKKKPEKQ